MLRRFSAVTECHALASWVGGYWLGALVAKLQRVGRYVMRARDVA